MPHVDTLIHARWIAPVEPAGVVHEHYAIAINDGRIEDLLPGVEAEQHYTADATERLDQHILIPGLINTHTHAAMSLMRGLADDLPLMTWLQEHIWPVEARCVSDEFVRDGVRHAVAEMIRSGTTCFNDMYFYADEAANVAAEAGMRAVVGLIVLDFPTQWAQNADEYLLRGQEIHDRLRHHSLVTTAFAPHAPYSVSDAPLRKLSMLAEELNIPVHMHIHETADEVEQSIQACGQRPIDRLKRLGILSPRLLAVHMTQLNDEDIATVVEHGCQIVHCPESNMKLASGACPVARLTGAGLNVALGTDGAASNNDLDMLGEMRSAALLAKLTAGDATALPGAEVLRMATLNGARALDIDGETGSLLPGKAADITAVDLGGLECQPLYDPVSQLVYAAGREHVSDVWVAGRRLLRQRALMTLDSQDILARAQHWQQQIRSA